MIFDDDDNDNQALIVGEQLIIIDRALINSLRLLYVSCLHKSFTFISTCFKISVDLPFEELILIIHFIGEYETLP